MPLLLPADEQVGLPLSRALPLIGHFFRPPLSYHPTLMLFPESSESLVLLTYLLSLVVGSQ